MAGDIPIDSLEDPHVLNAALHATPAQVIAMRCGSMFGFDGALADPDTYGANGLARLDVTRVRRR